MSTSPIGLRERKRAATRLALEAAAVELVLSTNLEEATVDAISERADVSPRTFFNYFTSKEDAILGLGDAEVTDETVAAQLEEFPQDDLAQSVVRLLFTIISPTVADAKLQESRREIVRRHPQLLERHMVHVATMGKQLTDAIQTLIEHDPRQAGSSAASTVAWSEVLLMMCAGAIKASVREAAAASSDAAAGTEATVEELEQRATQLVREVVEKLQ